MFTAVYADVDPSQVLSYYKARAETKKRCNLACRDNEQWDDDIPRALAEGSERLHTHAPRGRSAVAPMHLGLSGYNETGDTA